MVSSVIPGPENEVLTLTQAAELIPGNPSSKTVLLWIKKGIDGIKLDGVRIGGQFLTDRQSLNVFFAKTAV